MRNAGKTVSCLCFGTKAHTLVGRCGKCSLQHPGIHYARTVEHAYGYVKRRSAAQQCESVLVSVSGRGILKCGE